MRKRGHRHACAFWTNEDQWQAKTSLFNCTERQSEGLQNISPTESVVPAIPPASSKHPPNILHKSQGRVRRQSIVEQPPRKKHILCRPPPALLMLACLPTQIDTNRRCDWHPSEQGTPRFPWILNTFPDKPHLDPTDHSRYLFFEFCVNLQLPAWWFSPPSPLLMIKRSSMHMCVSA